MAPRMRKASCLGTSVPTARQIPEAAAGFGELGRVPSQGPRMAGSGAHSLAKPEPVHEMLEGTKIATCESPGSARGAAISIQSARRCCATSSTGRHGKESCPLVETSRHPRTAAGAPFARVTDVCRPARSDTNASVSVSSPRALRAWSTRLGAIVTATTTSLDELTTCLSTAEVLVLKFASPA